MQAVDPGDVHIHKIIEYQGKLGHSTSELGRKEADVLGTLLGRKRAEVHGALHDFPRSRLRGLLRCTLNLTGGCK
jgi:hypothetical protein